MELISCFRCWPACVHAKSFQSWLILCVPMDCSLPSSSVYGIRQARILEWLPCPPPGDLPDPRIEPGSPASPALAGGFFTTSAVWEALMLAYLLFNKDLSPGLSSQHSCCAFAAPAAESLQSCPTLCDPIDGSPPGFPCPWDSPGKNTGVGCHFLLQCMKVKNESEVVQSCPTLRDPMDCSLQAPPWRSFAHCLQ